MKNKERVIFTPGLSIRSNTKEYMELDNTIIAGVTGSGRGTLLNDMLYECINANSPGYFHYVYIDGQDSWVTPFANVNRISTYNLLMSEFSDIDYRDSVHKFLEIASAMKIPSTVNETLLIIIDRFSNLKAETQYLVRQMLHDEELSKHVKFWITVDSSNSNISYVYDSFRYRIITRCDAALSEDLFNCNLGESCADKYGTCWFWDTKRPELYSKHYVTFREDGFYARFLKGLRIHEETDSYVAHTYLNLLQKLDEDN